MQTTYSFSVAVNWNLRVRPTEIAIRLMQTASSCFGGGIFLPSIPSRHVVLHIHTRRTARNRRFSIDKESPSDDRKMFVGSNKVATEREAKKSLDDHVSQKTLSSYCWHNWIMEAQTDDLNCYLSTIIFTLCTSRRCEPVKRARILVEWTLTFVLLWRHIRLCEGGKNIVVIDFQSWE